MQTNSQNSTIGTKYYPTTQGVRAAWINNVTGATYMERLEYEAGFDEWLEALIFEHRQEAWEQGVMDANGKSWRNVPERDSFFHRYRDEETD